MQMELAVVYDVREFVAIIVVLQRSALATWHVSKGIAGNVTVTSEFVGVPRSSCAFQ